MLELTLVLVGAMSMDALIVSLLTERARVSQRGCERNEREIGDNVLKRRVALAEIMDQSEKRTHEIQVGCR